MGDSERLTGDAMSGSREVSAGVPLRLVAPEQSAPAGQQSHADEADDAAEDDEGNAPTARAFLFWISRHGDSPLVDLLNLTRGP
jgi:hypothetical protein